ncbi:MAG: prepilin-type N-terminal cleavage/methylation domain-containing protein [Oceanicoccus sp.]
MWQQAMFFDSGKIKNRRRRESGFTLVELVIVIVLLGLLAVAALPRFLDITDQAQTAAVEGVAGGFTMGTALVRAQWMADGNGFGSAGTVVTVDGGDILTNENGWPAQTSAGDASFNSQTAADCLEVWNFVMQNPPRATIGSIANNDNYLVSALSSSPNICVFTLIVNGEEDPLDRNFDYNLATGQVLVNLP